MTVLVDSEEFIDDADLFSEIELISPATNRCSTKPSTKSTLQVTTDSANNTDTEMDVDGDFDDIEFAWLDAHWGRTPIYPLGMC